jgi:hypothetical protein
MDQIDSRVTIHTENVEDLATRIEEAGGSVFSIVWRPSATNPEGRWQIFFKYRHEYLAVRRLEEISNQVS